jgi:aryl-alcohol dehydrogenase-like predicted oxidoreductase
MKYKLLGKSGLRVSEICLGTMTFGEDWGWGSNYEESKKVFDVYAQAGGNFIDTANMYTNGTSEKFVGDFIRAERQKWVLATKYSLNNQANGVNTCGNHRKNMIQSVEGSLSRLKVDYIDLLWLHVWDYTTPIEEVMRAFDDLVRAGKILYAGISDAPAWIVSAANTMAELRGWTPFIALQIEYSLKERTPERDLIPMADAFNLTVTPWSPLAGGLLTGKYNTNAPQGSDFEKGRLAIDGNVKFAMPSERELKIAETVVSIAHEIGRSPAQVALNWILQQGPNMIPIVGARKASQLQDNLGCVEFTLSPNHLKLLNEVSAIPLGFPIDFFKSEIAQNFAFSGTLQSIEYARPK